MGVTREGTHVAGTDAPGTHVPGTHVLGTGLPGTDVPGAEVTVQTLLDEEEKKQSPTSPEGGS